MVWILYRQSVCHIGYIADIAVSCYINIRMLSPSYPVLYVLKLQVFRYLPAFRPPKKTTFGYILGGLGFNMCISTWSFLCQGNQGISARPPDIIPRCCSEKNLKTHPRPSTIPVWTHSRDCLHIMFPYHMGEVFWRMFPLEISGTYRLPFWFQESKAPISNDEEIRLDPRNQSRMRSGPWAPGLWGLHLFKVLRTQAQTPPDLSLPTHQAHHGFEACQRLPENADGKLDSEWIIDDHWPVTDLSSWFAIFRNISQCKSAMCQGAADQLGSWSNSFNENGSILKWGILQIPPTSNDDKTIV